MKIVVASGIYPPDIGGPATYSQLIAREFSKKGIDVKVICYSDKEGSDVVRILRKHNLFKRYWLYYKNLLQMAKDADVVYAQGPLAAGLPAMRACKKLKKKFVIKIVGDYAWEQFQNKKSKIKNKKFIDIEKFQKNRYDFLTELRRKIQKIVVKSADKVIVPSEFLKKVVTGWGINGNKINVIYNAGPDLEKIKKIEPNNNIKAKGDIIISAGRLEPWKGMDVLITIMPDLLKINKNFRLIIIGRGPEWDKLKIKSQKLKVDDKVEIIDRVSHEELMKYFKASRIFVLNSGYEGLPHIILEAMACGLPVITTNVCGNPEVVQNGYNGLLVEYNHKEQFKDAILKLWNNKDLQSEIVENGYKTLENFRLSTMIDKTINALTL